MLYGTTNDFLRCFGLASLADLPGTSEELMALFAQGKNVPDKPEEEIAAAKNIFKALGIKGQSGMDIVSCPTCGRTKIDLIALVGEFERRVKEEGIDEKPIKVALMGCVVNGPGEAREADIGVAGGNGEAVLIKKGQIVEKISEDDIVERLINEIKKI
jgi:(E)-4-hydroxy-3-methylbut-2-enyl-diphosphate synthase